MCIPAPAVLRRRIEPPRASTRVGEAGQAGTTHRILTALNAGGGKITYEYDLGAGWIHEIALQDKVPREPGASYPFCVKYSGDPPVECPDYDSDEEQQPEPFDLEAVNRRLAALGSGQP